MQEKLEKIITSSSNHVLRGEKGNCFFLCLCLYTWASTRLDYEKTKTFSENWVSQQSFFALILTTSKTWNNTFWFFKIESWTFQHLFEKEFCETSQNVNSFSLFRQLWFSIFLLTVRLSWNFLFQTYAENFSFLSFKTKKFYT